MHKSFTLKKFQNTTKGLKIKKGTDYNKPSSKAIAFIMAYAAALSVIKTKIGDINVLLN